MNAYDLLQRTFRDVILPELPSDLANVAAEVMLLLDTLNARTINPAALQRQMRALSDTVVAVKMARRLRNIHRDYVYPDSSHTHSVNPQLTDYLKLKGQL